MMRFTFQFGFAIAILAATATGAAIERAYHPEDHAIAEVNVGKRDDDTMHMMAPGFKFCRNRDFVDCVTFTGIQVARCCKPDAYNSL